MRTGHRPAQGTTEALTAFCSSIVAPEIAGLPNVWMRIVSAVASAAIDSWCVTFEGRFPGTPSADC
jgi:hypothetical protein